MAVNILEKIRNSRAVTKTVSISKRIVLPGFEGQSLFVIASAFWQGITKGALVTRASAISFKVFLAIFPTIILMLSLIPLLPIENLQGRLIDGIAQIMPHDAHALLSNTINDLITYKHTTVFSIGMVLTLYYSSNSINTILTCLNSSYNVDLKNNPLRQRAIALGLVLVLAILLFIAIALSVGNDIFLSWLQRELVVASKFSHAMYQIARWTLVVMVYMMVVSILYNFGNKATKWKWMSAGATMATVIFVLSSAAFALYFDNFNNYNKLYGSLGTLILILMWIQINSIILLIGFELNASIYSSRKRQANPA